MAHNSRWFASRAEKAALTDRVRARVCVSWVRWLYAP